jgi:Domain of unknown function (DUF4402)
VKCCAIPFVIFSLFLTGEAASAASGNGAVQVDILGPNTLVNTAALDFGTLYSSAAAGTVSLNAQTGIRTVGGGATAAGGTVSTGKFTGTGTAGRVVTLSLAPLPTITLTNPGGATMTINQIRVSVNGGNPQPFGPNHTIPVSRVITFAVGGRLNVAAGQAEGLYTSTITMTMNYQ